MKKILWAVAALLVAWLGLVYAAQRTLPDGKLHVFVLDVGQGDSILITTPIGQHILVDGGPSNAVVAKVASYLPFYRQHIDLVVSTHPDADHVTGLVGVINHIPVDRVLYTGFDSGTKTYHDFVQALEAHHMARTNAVAGQSAACGPACRIDVLHPWPEILQTPGVPSNDTGIVLRLVYGNNSLLLTADISSVEEQKLLRGPFNLDSDVIKVAHHGSKYSSSPLFIKDVSPRFSLISVGAKNPYGHPTTEVIGRLGESAVYRTDRAGDIAVELTGADITVHTQKRLH